MNRLPLNLFVYGTLLSGLENHFYLTGCKYLGRAKTMDKYALYHHDYPKLTQRIKQVEIIGEVYLIEDSEALQRLDELEEHPIVYCRIDCKVKLDESDIIIDSQIYFNDNFDLNDEKYINIKDGDYRNFISNN